MDCHPFDDFAKLKLFPSISCLTIVLDCYIVVGQNFLSRSNLAEKNVYLPYTFTSQSTYGKSQSSSLITY